MLIAITGGPATGKSTLYRMLQEMRRFVSYDADAAVHALLDSDANVITEIANAFGPEVLNSVQGVDRHKLRKKVFAEPSARHQLEGIIHPRVRAQWMAQRAQCQADRTDFLAEIPLLFETDAAGYFDHNVVVACSPEQQRQRLAERGLDVAAINRQLASQLPLATKIGRADEVLWNDGSGDSLRHQARLLLQRLPFPENP